MSYLVLARKWRPQTFADLIGQEHVSRTLQNAIGSGRVAHAFLFTGARGVGKTSAARILAKALNCEAGPAAEPCNTCSLCSEITDGNSVDVFEIDGDSNTSVDDVRELRETVKYLPSRARRKIFIIDEVHMLSTSAFNALLKTLEEPPPHITFIFATTEPHKVPITIERHEKGSVIITTNLGFADWTQVFGGPVMTAALLDRLTHRAHIVNCQWESYRLKQSLKGKEKKE